VHSLILTVQSGRIAGRYHEKDGFLLLTIGTMQTGFKANPRHPRASKINILRFYATGWLSRLAILTRGFKKETIWHYILRGSERLDSTIRIQMAVWRNWRIMTMQKNMSCMDR